MSRFPGARWRPLPENAYQSAIDPSLVILHSAVDAHGPTSLFGFFSRSDVRVESHFFIRLDGRIEQYLDTNVRADCNRRANKRPDGTGAISIETEDDGDPNNRPWTQAQIDSIIAIILWAHEEHGIPLRVCENPWDDGIGFHSQWGSPSDWTPAAGKTCPGYVRIDQFWDVIVPAITTHNLTKGLTMDSDTAAGLATLTYTALLFRTPSMKEVLDNAHRISVEGLAPVVAGIANSEEATNARALLRKKMGLTS